MLWLHTQVSYGTTTTVHYFSTVVVAKSGTHGFGRGCEGIYIRTIIIAYKYSTWIYMTGVPVKSNGN